MSEIVARVPKDQLSSLVNLRFFNTVSEVREPYYVQLNEILQVRLQIIKNSNNNNKLKVPSLRQRDDLPARLLFESAGCEKHCQCGYCLGK